MGMLSFVIFTEGILSLIKTFSLYFDNTSSQSANCSISPKPESSERPVGRLELYAG